MRFFKNLLHVIVWIFSLLCALIVLCAFYPGLTDKITDFLYPQNQSEAATSASLPVGPAQEAPSVSTEDAVNVVQNPGLLEAPPDSLPETYLPPDEADIVIPEEVSSKNGYLPIQENSEQIEDGEAKELQEQLSIGSSGDEYGFDALFYPYYAMLDETGKHLYRQIYANSLELFPSFAPVEDITAPELKNVFTAVYNDHPELFWLDTAYLCRFRRDGRCVEIRLQFNQTAEDLENQQAVFQEAARTIMDKAPNTGSSLEKETAVHDALLENVTYDLAAEMNQSAYSAFVNGKTVCAGYARAFQYAMQQLGVPCYYCTGYAGESHAWNIISLEDGFYNVDSTWDDTQPGTYDYFNKSDRDFATTHIRKDLSVYLPPCSTETYPGAQGGTDETQKRRSLEDVGAEPEDVLKTLPGYYRDCYDHMMEAGLGTYQFSNVLEGDALFQEWYDAYQVDAYREGYMEAALEEMDASSCEIDLTFEKLQDERYYITHHVAVR